LAALRFGLSEWALVNRLTGWAVVIGYFAAGAVLARLSGDVGLRIALSTLATVALTIVFDVGRRLVWLMPDLANGGAGFFDQFYDFGQFSGFLPNRNAFGFAVLCTMIFALPVLKQARAKPEKAMLAILLAIAGMGVVLTNGRVAQGTLLLLVPVIAVFVLLPRRALNAWVYGGFLVAALVSLVAVTAYSLASATGAGGSAVDAFARQFVDRSILLRDDLNAAAVDLWREHPVFGGGLGAFLETSAFAEYQNTLHNVWIWALAELGIVGLAAIAGFFVVASVHALRVYLHERSDHAVGILFLMAVFVLFSFFHDVLYQRSFWFFLGFLVSSTAWPTLRPSRI
jgi:O-antigen ligase